MRNEKNHQSLYTGAAVVAGVLSALSALMHSNKKVKNWGEQAKDVAHHMLEKGEAVNKKMMLGGVVGGLIGAATALLLAPKPGTELIKDLNPFSHQTRPSRAGTRKTASRKTVSSHKDKGQKIARESSKKEAHKKRSTAPKRHAPARKRPEVKVPVTEQKAIETSDNPSSV